MWGCVAGPAAGAADVAAYRVVQESLTNVSALRPPAAEVTRDAHAGRRPGDEPTNLAVGPVEGIGITGMRTARQAAGRDVLCRAGDGGGSGCAATFPRSPEGPP